MDLGLGAVPWTTLEWARALRAVAPGLPLLGVEIDPDRVARARLEPQPGIDPPVRFVEGGFDLPGAPPARLIRAMNVLRQYPPDRCGEARAAMGARLIPGGLLVEGTSARESGTGVAGWWRRREAGLALEAIAFLADLERGFAPGMFRRWLPRDEVRGGPIHQLLEDWEDAWRGARGDPAEAFDASAAALSGRRAVERWGRGVMLWRPPG